jgi:hypothetical protein
MKKYAAALAGVVQLCVAASAAGQDLVVDDREDFAIAPYVGIAIDSFAAGDVSQYLNQGDSGNIEERATAGFEFAYRLWGDAAAADVRDGQLWVYGRTTHGVRSADVDCRATPDIPVCRQFSLELQDPTTRGLYLLRNASSLEGMAGLRWEFRQIRGGKHAARAYVSGQLGFLSVSDGPDDVADVHQIAVGGVVTTGLYKNSYFEVGYGRNDLILENRSNRFKFNARVVRRWNKNDDDALGHVFAHIAVDVDGSDGSDSIQTYLGVAFAIRGGDR